jgi:hypothetical protein
MKSKILLVILCLFIASYAKADPTPEKSDTKFRHDLILVIKLPTADGSKEIKLPWTITSNGQSLEYTDALENINIQLSVGEILKNSADLNYAVFRNGGSDTGGRFLSKSYAEFKFNTPREISINADKVVSLSLQSK